MSTPALVAPRTGQALAAAEQIVGYYGPGTFHGCDEDGTPHITYARGVISEHVPHFTAAGGTIRVAPSGARWAVLPDGEAVPVLCSEIIAVATEDGPSDGRCGSRATRSGTCPAHA